MGAVAHVLICRLEASTAVLRNSYAAPPVTARVESMQFPASVLMEHPPVNSGFVASQAR